MQTHDFEQGSDSWHQHRSTHLNASDAPAMMGESPYMTRTQLLQAMHTGLRAEVTPQNQRRFDKGHAIEAAMRPVAEAIIGEDLYPVVGSDGELSASFDGLTMAEDTNWECKSLNDALRAALPHPGPDGNDAANLPRMYRIQLEHQCAVARKVERVLFTASDGNGDDRHCWYTPDPALRAEILAAWAQFASDLANYEHIIDVQPVAMGRAPESLPALRIEVTGMVTASNLDAFKEHALAVFKGINRTLTTDTEFADAEKTVKWCSEVEDRLKAAKEHALSQTESIDALFRTIDTISAEARTVRLELDKLVKARKEALRGEIVAGGVKALADHIAGLNTRLGERYMPQIPADFGGKVKGLRTVQSIRDAVDGEVARCKIIASETADRIEANMKAMAAAADDASFHDAAMLVLKAPDDLAAIIAQRCAETRRAREEQTERIRADLQREQEAQQAAEAAKPAPTPAPVVIAAPAAPSPALNVVPMGTRAPKTPPTLTLGAIGKRLGFSVTADFLKQLGFEPAARDKSALLFHEATFDLVCESLIAHIRTVAAKQLEAA